MSIAPSFEAPLRRLPDDSLPPMFEYGPDVMLVLRPDGRCRARVGGIDAGCSGGQPGCPGRDRSAADLVLGSRPFRDRGQDLLDKSGRGRRVQRPSSACTAYGDGWTWMEANARRLPGATGVAMSLRDITARKQEEALLIEANDLLRRRATLDPVTCLPNRGHFLSMLERELAPRPSRGDIAQLPAVSRSTSSACSTTSMAAMPVTWRCAKLPSRSRGRCAGPATSRGGWRGRCSACCCQPPTSAGAAACGRSGASGRADPAVGTCWRTIWPGDGHARACLLRHAVQGRRRWCGKPCARSK